MNLDEYRELKAQESSPKEEQPNAQTNENTVVATEQTLPAQAQTSTTPNEAGEQDSTSTESSIPTEIEIDGKKVSIDELKGGYLRQSDYTRKTQELARNKEELKRAEEVYQAIYKDAETAKEISERLGIDYVSPEQAQTQEIHDKYQSLLLERDIEKLQAKYGEFDVNSVLRLAYDKRIPDLEDAYLLSVTKREATPNQSTSLDIETIKEQIRQELKQELQSTVDTSSLISTSSSGKQITDDTPQLTQAELKVARAMRISPAEYAKHKTRK